MFSSALNLIITPLVWENIFIQDKVILSSFFFFLLLQKKQYNFFIYNQAINLFCHFILLLYEIYRHYLKGTRFYIQDYNKIWPLSITFPLFLTSIIQMFANKLQTKACLWNRCRFICRVEAPILDTKET